MTTLIRPIVEADSEAADWIAVQAFNESEVLTALRNGSGNLELISWHTAPGDFTIARGPDSSGSVDKEGNPTGEATDIALTLVGRRAVTAVRAGNGDLKLISWDVPAGLGSITRLDDTGTAAGEASNIAMTVLYENMLITAVRDGSGDLKLISWRLEADGTIPRLKDSEGQAGEVQLVTIAPVDANNVVTAVKDGSDNLKLIGWSVSPVDGSFDRWPFQPSPHDGEAGEVREIALMSLGSDGATTTMVTAVKDGSDELTLIAWRLSPGDGRIDRLADSHGLAGEASDIAICSIARLPSGTQTIMTSMRDGSGRLTLIAFNFIANTGGSPVFFRTGEVRREVDVETIETNLVALEPGRIFSASRINNNLQLKTYSVSDLSATLIRPIAEADSEEASWIAVQAFNESEVLTALRNGSGNLELISWHTAPSDFTITRGADSSGSVDKEGNPTGEATDIALTLVGRRAVTAVRAGNDDLKLISWDIPPGLGSITRLDDTGTAAGEASHIAMTVLYENMLITAVKDGSDNLKLISWRLEADGTIPRLKDSEGQAGEVQLVTIAAVDANNVVTAVKDGSDDLKLIGWKVSPVDGSFERWANDGQAGEVREIALMSLGSDGVTTTMVTAVKDGSDDLTLIAWQVSPVDNTFTRLADSHALAGEASAIAICSIARLPSGTQTIMTSMRDGSGKLTLIAFNFIANTGGEPVFVRTGEVRGEANRATSDTDLAALEPGRILSAARINGNLQLRTYNISDAIRTPAPSTILELEFQNPPLPAIDDTSWAKNFQLVIVEIPWDGKIEFDTYPIASSNEWVQTLAHEDEYDNSALVGAAGWVLAPEESGADMPPSHPFGFDYEFQIALDDNPNNNTTNKYSALLSPANADLTHNNIELAHDLGLSVPRGVIGMEWDKALLPQSFRGQVNHGDRVALLGRWILDAGHSFNGFYRTEIHPPLLVATGSVQQQPNESPFTRVLFMSRPFLPGQTFSQDVGKVYDDSAEDDGGFLSHLVSEIVRVITLESRQVEAHPKIKSFPFRGQHNARFIIRPPQPPDSDEYELAVSYKFTVRPGFQVNVTSTAKDQVNVNISLNESEYTPPSLPNRKARRYFLDELEKLNPDAKWAGLLEAVAVAVADQIPVIGGPFLAAYVAYILTQRGIITDEYENLPEFNILDSTQAALNIPADHIPPGSGIVVDNDQKYPITGWLEAKWQRKVVPISEADVLAKLEELAKAYPVKLNWEVSIVDLLVLLNLQSSYEVRQEMAVKLGCPTELMKDSAKMNVFLHQTILKKMAENGGNIPKELLGYSL